MSNDCDKLASLTKFPTDSNISPALNQGITFKNYQTKFVNHLDKKSVYIKEGFESGSNNMLEANILTNQSNEIVAQNNFDNQQAEIDKLREQYQNKLSEYQALTDKINGSANSYLDRVNNNPYLGKNIKFTTGHVCYVTQQGVVKHIPDPSIWDSIADKNGCPGKNYTDVNMPWLPEYDTPGTPIEPLNLITGTPMQSEQSCGFAGKNIFVNSLINNPKEKYIGCYNDKPPSTDILFVPIMNSSNNVSGYRSRASSVYQNNNNRFGAWAAFNRVADPYWHSEVGGSTNYNGKTGEYSGVNKWDYKDANGNMVQARGEWIWIECPPGNVLTKYDIQGRQGCCGNPNGRSPNSWVIIGGVYNQGYELVDKRDNQGLSFETRTYTITNPKKYNHYIFLTTNCGNPGDRSGNRYCVQIAQWNLYTSSNYSFTDDKRAMTWNPAEIGYTDLETCKKYAVDNGYQYFGMQDGKEDGTAACLVSNDLAKSTMYGRGYKYKGLTLWQSNTSGGTGNIAMLNETGSLVVNNSGGAAVWASPSGKLDSSYIGCYADKSNRAMQNTSNNRYLTFDECKKLAVDGKFQYFATQDRSSNKTGWCAASNSISEVKKYGVANNCGDIDGNMMGGGWSNAVYSSGAGFNSFLILQDDGNMCVYRGTGPNDNQGAIWATGTNGIQRQKNSNFSAENSKFGKNWIPNGTTLAAGDFVGSNDGSIYLLMQSDGNLVLYTSSNVSACSANSKGQQVGGGWMNAIYQLLPTPFKENIGKLGYVDQENMLHEYDSNNTQLTNVYSKFTKVNTPGNDIPGATYGGANIEQCKSTCTNNKDCYGFVFDNTNKVCWPKSSAMWPYGGPQNPLTTTDIYVRGKAPIAPPVGVSKDVENIDSVQYQYYATGGKLDAKYGLANATQAEQQELDRLQNEMKNLSGQIATLTDEYGEGTSNAQNQSDKNTTGLYNYLKQEEHVQSEIDKMNPNREGFRPNNNIDKILQDSDIVVLQKNYDYLFWTILAAGSVLVAMNIKTSP